MTDEFTLALYGAASQPIPGEYDWFAPLIGDWEFDYCDFPEGRERHVAGEWIFRRILNGAGIEDLFICPSRKTRVTAPQPDGEYGAAIRIFNAATKSYDMVYACDKYTVSLNFRKEGEKLVGTVTERPREKWVFCDLRENSFQWNNITVTEDGASMPPFTPAARHLFLPLRMMCSRKSQPVE